MSICLSPSRNLNSQLGYFDELDQDGVVNSHCHPQGHPSWHTPCPQKQRPNLGCHSQAREREKLNRTQEVLGKAGPEAWGLCTQAA